MRTMPEILGKVARTRLPPRTRFDEADILLRVSQRLLVGRLASVNIDLACAAQLWVVHTFVLVRGITGAHSPQ
jgi:hypothetical protein